MVRFCSHCQKERAVLKRPKTFEQLCRECFYTAFEEEVHTTITTNKLFKRGERVALAASGGKDSTVLAHVVTLLNKRYDYGLDLFLLSIDEGISGYRDDSLETVKRNERTYGIPLEVVSYKQLYNWTMDEIVSQIGTKNNCTFCGVFRRQALDRGAVMRRANKIATGHNADDVAETVLLNILRGDVPRLGRCTNIITGEDSSLPRVKPFKYTYEKEIVMYAYFKKLDYFSTECIYAPFAARGFARDFVKDLEHARPSAIVDLIRSAESFRLSTSGQQNLPQPGKCRECGYISSQPVCKACVLLEGLNKGRPRTAVGDAPVTAADAAAQQQGACDGSGSCGGPCSRTNASSNAQAGQQHQQQPAEAASAAGASGAAGCGESSCSGAADSASGAGLPEASPQAEAASLSHQLAAARLQEDGAGAEAQGQATQGQGEAGAARARVRVPVSIGYE